MNYKLKLGRWVKLYFTTLTPSARADFQEGRCLKIILHTYIKNIKQLQHTDSTLLHGIFGITHK